jgi:hypothetical protein
MNIYVEYEWIFMLKLNEYLCWIWMNIYVEVEWIFMLNMNEYFVEYEWIFMLKLNEYLCWIWMNIYVEVEWIFMLNMNEYFCWSWMNIYVEYEWIFLLKLNEYLCWIWIFFLNMNKFVEVEWIFFLNMNANSWSWTNIFCWILKQITNHNTQYFAKCKRFCEPVFLLREYVGPPMRFYLARDHITVFYTNPPPRELFPIGYWVSDSLIHMIFTT